MLIDLVVGLAAIFQYTATFLAFRVLRVTGRAPVWLLIAAVSFLMAVRRSIVLYRSLSQSMAYEPDPVVECVGLAISVLMVVGVVRIGPFFLSILQSREELRKRTHDLDKRVKELSLVFRVSRLLENPDITFEELIQKIVELCPRSWQYPDIACARIVLNNQVFATPNFKDTIWKQACDVTVHGMWIGSVEVRYLEGKPECDEGPFLKEERNLLLALAERLGDIIKHNQAAEMIQHQQSQLVHASRVSAMGEMASALAHELNQPLCVIEMSTDGCLRMIRSGSGNTEDLVHALGVVSSQAERAGEIVHNLKNFVRKREPKSSSVDINDVVRQAIKLAEAEVRYHGLTMRTELADRVPMVQADSIQIQQVIVNLVRNAIEAMENVTVDKRDLAIRTAAFGSDAVEVAVSDTGKGPPDDDVDRLFDSFFTTKHDGMGMGLSISQSIIEGHGGSLWATPNLDCGMTFRFTLPIANGENDAS